MSEERFQSPVTDHRTPQLPTRHQGAQLQNAQLLLSVIHLWLILACGFFVGTTVFSGTHLMIPMVLVFFALLLLAVTRWTGAILLAVLQVHLLLMEPGRRSQVDGLGTVVLVAVFVALLMLISRFSTLQQARRSSIFDLGRGLWRFLSSRDVQHATPTAQATWNFLLQMIVALIPALVWSLVLTAGATALLGQLPMSGSIRDWVVQLPDGQRAARPQPAVLVAVMAICVLTGEAVWRQLTFSQASVYLRTTLVQTQYAELRMIVVRLIRGRRSKRSSKTKTDDKP